jgi:hypothetical protein
MYKEKYIRIRLRDAFVQWLGGSVQLQETLFLQVTLLFVFRNIRQFRHVRYTCPPCFCKMGRKLGCQLPTSATSLMIKAFQGPRHFKDLAYIVWSKIQV